METTKRTWLVRILTGSALGLLAGVILVPCLMSTRGAPPLVCLLCAALGGAAGVATLPFADDGRTLLLHSGLHFAVTSALFLLLAAQFCSVWDWQVLLLLEGALALLYALIWTGRWIGWYAEIRQLRALLGLAPGPSPLKWRETLPYLPFALILCDVLPALLRWAERALNGGWIDVPVLSGLLLPCLILPAAGFCSGLSLGKRQGLCPLYPLALALCYLPMVFALYNASALFLCLMSSLPALVGNAAGWLWRRSR